MSSLEKKQIDLLRSLADVFFEKISPDVRFKNQRIKEWCLNLPPTPSSTKDSNDASAIEKIKSIHRELEKIDDENAVKGYTWSSHNINEFQSKLNELHETITTSDVDQSIYNIYHVHEAVFFRAQGKYEEALQAIGNSSRLLKIKIENHPSYLPRYTRELIMNLGVESELHRLQGEIAESIELADKMHAQAMEESKNGNYLKEDEKAQCKSSNWALYYCCEAYLAEPVWNQTSRGNWYFSHTFCNHLYKEWTIPVLIKIIGNPIWEERYPTYFDSIADSVYVGTSKDAIRKLLRKISVHLGRVQLRHSKALSAVTLVAILVVMTALNQGSKPEAGNMGQHVTEAIEQLVQRGHIIDPEVQSSVALAVEREAEEVMSSNPSEVQNSVDLDDKLADRGVGVGIMADAHYLLPVMAYASDRGIGVA